MLLDQCRWFKLVFVLTFDFNCPRLEYQSDQVEILKVFSFLVWSKLQNRDIKTNRSVFNSCNLQYLIFYITIDQNGNLPYFFQSLGFTQKDTDEVKGIFADTNLVLLLVTFGVSAIHLLFDFLAFKNDVAFWRSKRTMVGLSTRTVLWRAFSQTVVFFYLLDENTSLLVIFFLSK